MVLGFLNLHSFSDLSFDMTSIPGHNLCYPQLMGVWCGGLAADHWFRVRVIAGAVVNLRLRLHLHHNLSMLTCSERGWAKKIKRNINRIKPNKPCTYRFSRRLWRGQRNWRTRDTASSIKIFDWPLPNLNFTAPFTLVAKVASLESWKQYWLYTHSPLSSAQRKCIPFDTRLLMYTVEPLYKGHTGTMKIVLYKEVSLIQRLIIHESISFGSKQVSFIQRCSLFGSSTVRIYMYMMHLSTTSCPCNVHMYLYIHRVQNVWWLWTRWASFIPGLSPVNWNCQLLPWSLRRMKERYAVNM